MQQRHLNRKQYFCELANTARTFYMEYLNTYIKLTPDTRVLEIGCGEGGNLLPFAEQGCKVTGIDICQTRINEAQTFFTEYHQQGTFICQDFLLSKEPKTEDEWYDLILVHDVIEHIELSHKRDFLRRIKKFLKQRGIAFFGFPAWQSPFGGHQQISVGLASKLPFIHLLPKALYKDLLKTSGATASIIGELMSIRASRVTIENFERQVSEVGYTICQRTILVHQPTLQTEVQHESPPPVYFLCQYSISTKLLYHICVVFTLQNHKPITIPILTPIFCRDTILSFN